MNGWFSSIPTLSYTAYTYLTLYFYNHLATTPIDPHKTDSNEPGLGSVFYSSGWPQSLAWAASQWPSPAPAKLAIQLGEKMLEKFGSPTKIFKIWAIMGIEPNYSHIRTKFYGNRTNKKYVSPTKTGLQHPPTIEFLGYSVPSGWLWLTACHGKWPILLRKMYKHDDLPMAMLHSYAKYSEANSGMDHVHRSLW
jgi:hypothetical protein